jgi:hypothetical protein
MDPAPLPPKKKPPRKPGAVPRWVLARWEEISAVGGIPAASSRSYAAGDGLPDPARRLGSAGWAGMPAAGWLRSRSCVHSGTPTAAPLAVSGRRPSLSKMAVRLCSMAVWAANRQGVE